MSNRTISGALSVHGRDPQLLVEKIVRERIYESMFWKEECFGLTAESILDKAVQVSHVGGTFGNQRPVPFLCLLLKLLQIQPTSEIVEEYIRQEDFKYLRILALFYVRLTGSHVAVYTTLEPFLADRRKLRLRLPTGAYCLSHVDEVIDDLLTKERVFDIILPRLMARAALEDDEQIGERPALLPADDEWDDAPAIGDQKQAPPADRDADQHAGPLPDFGDRESLSVEETNALRIRLGLKPLS